MKNPSSTIHQAPQKPFHESKAEIKARRAYLYSYILSLLENLYGIEQSPRYHPEGDALYHSLQVFQQAQADTDDPELLAAALLHDVGKAMDYSVHDKVGAESLDGLLSPRIIWLIRHHLDLLVSPQKTRRRLSGSQRLNDLEKLRKWDIAGRSPDAEVIKLEEAIDTLFINYTSISQQSADPDYCR